MPVCGSATEPSAAKTTSTNDRRDLARVLHFTATFPVPWRITIELLDPKSHNMNKSLHAGIQIGDFRRAHEP